MLWLAWLPFCCYVVSMWLVRGWYVVGMWLVCGCCLVAILLLCCCSHGSNFSWLHATSSSAPDAKKTLKMEKGPTKCYKLSKNAQKVLQSAHIKRVSVSRMSVPILPSSRLISARKAIKFWQIFVMSTTSNQFENSVKFPETCCGRSGLWYTSFKPLSRNSWIAEVNFSITTHLQTVVRGYVMAHD